MTAKQIKYFGTAAQRAALKRRKSNAGVFSRRKTKKYSKSSAAKARGVKRSKINKYWGKRTKNPRNYGTRLGRSWSTATAEGRAAGAKVSRFRAAKASGTYKRKKGSPRRSRRKNVGAIYSIGLAGLNPGRKRRTKNSGKKRGTKRSLTNMARRRRNRSKVVSHRRRRVYRRRSNPGSYRRRRAVGRRHHSRRRHNPGIGGAIGSTTGMFKNALSVIGGAVASRYATQLALGANNSGAIGYLGNAVASLALGWAAGKFMKSPQIGAMVTLGGFTGLALRMLSDLTPIGQYVNLSLSGAGKVGDTGIGLITDTTFYVPTVFNNGSMTNAMVPNQITSLIAAGSVGSKAGVGNYRRRRAA